MKSLLDVKTEIASLNESRKETELTPRQESRAKNRIEFLKTVELYLENNPDELYLGREIKRIENRINKIIESFDPTPFQDPKEPKKEYEKEMGIPHLRLQLKTLRYIKN